MKPPSSGADSVFTAELPAKDELALADGPPGESAPTADAQATTTDVVVSPQHGHAISIKVLAVLAVLYSLYFARSFLVPITFAILLDFLFSPAVRALQKLRISPPLAALLIIGVLIGVASLGVYQLSGPVQTWAAKAPETLGVAQRKLRGLLKPIDRMTKTAEQVQSAASGGGGTGTAKQAEVVVVRPPSVASRLLGTTQRLVVNLLEILFLLYFLLAAGDLFLQKLIKVIPTLRDKKKAVRIAREIETSISTYLVTTSMTNLGEAIVVSGAMWALGMPNPVLWGVLTFFFEFIPYLGAAAVTVIVGVAALSTFDNLGQALLVPATFLLINLLQGNVISPLLLGHRLSLNPVALFVGLAFWYWIWGVPGAFLAVPVLAALKICCDHIETLSPVGEFLGMKDAPYSASPSAATPNGSAAGGESAR